MSKKNQTSQMQRIHTGGALLLSHFHTTTGSECMRWSEWKWAKTPHSSQNMRVKPNVNAWSKWHTVLVLSCPCKQKTTFQNWVLCLIQIFPILFPFQEITTSTTFWQNKWLGREDKKEGSWQFWWVLPMTHRSVTGPWTWAPCHDSINIYIIYFNATGSKQGCYIPIPLQ